MSDVEIRLTPIEERLWQVQMASRAAAYERIQQMVEQVEAEVKKTAAAIAQQHGQVLSKRGMAEVEAREDGAYLVWRGVDSGEQVRRG